MEDKIWAVVDEYINAEGYVQKWKDDIALSTSIEDLFATYPEQWLVDDKESFDSPGVTTGVVSVAFLEDGELKLININWEMN